jgi:hypothetical protein
MTQTPTRHAALERYLTLATWGLWGSNKHTLRLELESHVRHKAWKYQVQGFNENDAIQKALEDLGQAQTICAGMNGVYTMPNMIRQTFLVGILMSLGVAGFNSSAQIATIDRLPIEPCLNTTRTEIKNPKETIYCGSEDLWVRKTDLLGLLRDKGVTLRNDQFVFPPNNPTSLQWYSEGASFQQDGKGKLYKYSDDYLELPAFVAGLYNSNLPVKLEGWNNPKVTVGETQFSLGSPRGTFPSDRLYWGLLSKNIFKIFEGKRYGSGRREDDATIAPSSTMHRLTVIDEPERVYMLFTLEQSNDSQTIWGRIKPVGERGTLEFAMQNPQLRLVRGYNDLKPARPSQATTGVLVRFKTNLGDPEHLLEIVDPNSVLIGATERVIAKNTTPTSFCASRGGIDLSLQGKWAGTFTAKNPQGQTQTGKLESEHKNNGLTTGWITNDSIKLSSTTVGTVCKDGSSLNSYSYDALNVLTSKGKITKQPDGSLRGQSEEFENNKLIGKTEFVLRRQ